MTTTIRLRWNLRLRLLDRYLLRELLLPLLYSLDAFVLLWLVMDAFGHVDDFAEGHATAALVLRYYVVMLPEVLLQVVPMSLLLGLLFCLSSLAKRNELLAMRASGLSLLRVALPLGLVSVAASLAVFVINEWLAPQAHEQSNALLRQFRGRAAVGVIEPLFFTNESAQRDWHARRFYTHTRILENPEIHVTTSDGRPRLDLYAERGRWEERGWVFTGVDLYEHVPGGESRLTRVAETNLTFLTERPNRLVLENKEPADMSSSELRRAIRTQQRLGRSGQRTQLEVALQARHAFPATCLIVACIGIPLGMQTRRSGPMLSIGTALILVVGYYFGTQICLALGRGQQLPPAVAAWAVNVVFAVIAAVLAWRLR